MVICHKSNTPLPDVLDMEGADEILRWFDLAMWLIEQERPKKS